MLSHGRCTLSATYVNSALHPSGVANSSTSLAGGTLKTRDWKTQDWKTWDQIAGVEKAGLENKGPNRRGGKGRTGKRGNIMCMGSEM